MRGCRIALLSACLFASAEGAQLRGFMDAAKGLASAAGLIAAEDENDKSYLLKTNAKLNNGKSIVPPFKFFHSRFNPYDYTTYSQYDNWKDMQHKPLDLTERLKMGLLPFMDDDLPPAKPAGMLYNQVGNELQILHDEYDKKQTMLDIDFTHRYNEEEKNMAEVGPAADPMFGKGNTKKYNKYFGVLADLQNQHARRSMMLKNKMQMSQLRLLKRLPPPPRKTEQFMAFEGPIAAPPLPTAPVEESPHGAVG